MSKFAAANKVGENTARDNEQVAAQKAMEARLAKLAKSEGYTLEYVSWEDTSRSSYGDSNAGINVSCWGTGIADVRLHQNNGVPLFVIRKENWNETVGTVFTDEVAVPVGNHVPGGSPIKPVTLYDVANNLSTYAPCVDPASPSFVKSDQNRQREEMTIRFQLIFLAMPKRKAGDPPVRVQFSPEVYSYNTIYDDDPRNLLMLACPQGASFQYDKSDAAFVMHHEVDANGNVHRFWLEAEPTNDKVGQSQLAVNAMTDEKAKAEELDAAARGKSTAIRMGPKFMQTRKDMQMLVQWPLEQKPRPKPVYAACASFGFGMNDTLCMMESQSKSLEDDDECLEEDYDDSEPDCQGSATAGISDQSFKIGKSSAGRVSRGDEYDSYKPEKRVIKRDPSGRGTITCNLVVAVEDGQPSEEDVKNAIKELNWCYSQCNKASKLSEDKSLTVQLNGNPVAQAATAAAALKPSIQPYKPPVFASGVVDSGFPVAMLE